MKHLSACALAIGKTNSESSANNAGLPDKKMCKLEGENVDHEGWSKSSQASAIFELRVLRSLMSDRPSNYLLLP